MILWTAIVWLAPLAVLAVLVVVVDPSAVAHLHQVVVQVHQLHACLSATANGACGAG